MSTAAQLSVDDRLREISQEEVSSYRENGWVKLEGLIAPSLAGEMLERAKAHLETEKPLREMMISPDEKKLIRGFMFLSEKPILYVLNIGESTELGKDLENAVAKYKLGDVAARHCLWIVEIENVANEISAIAGDELVGGAIRPGIEPCD